MTDTMLEAGKMLQNLIQMIRNDIEAIDSIDSTRKKVSFNNSQIQTVRLESNDNYSGLRRLKNNHLQEVHNATKVYRLLLKDAYENQLKQLEGLYEHLSEESAIEILEQLNSDKKK